MPNPIVIDVAGENETQRVAAAPAAALPERAVISLSGTLGAGKTRFVQALATAAGVDRHAVTSPTFVLIQEYQARLPIFHFDAYRLRGEAEFYDLGGHEYFGGDGVCLIEWADRVDAALPADHLRLTLTVTGETTRQLHIEGRGEHHAPLVALLAVAAP